MVSGGCWACSLRTSCIVSFVFSTFRLIFFYLRHGARQLTLRLWTLTSLLLMIRSELDTGVQSRVSRVKRRGLSTHPWGAPVLGVMVLEVLSSSQLHSKVLSLSWKSA